MSASIDSVQNDVINCGSTPAPANSEDAARGEPG